MKGWRVWRQSRRRRIRWWWCDLTSRAGMNHDHSRRAGCGRSRRRWWWRRRRWNIYSTRRTVLEERWCDRPEGRRNRPRRTSGVLWYNREFCILRVWFRRWSNSIGPTRNPNRSDREQTLNAVCSDQNCPLDLKSAIRHLLGSNESRRLICSGYG